VTKPRKQADSLLGLLALVKDRFDSLLKLSFIARAGMKCSNVEHKQSSEEVDGDVSVDDTLSEAFTDCGFADTWLSDEHWIVFRSVD
jgi:hypothetical protein